MYPFFCNSTLDPIARGSKKRATLRMPPPRGSAAPRSVGRGSSQARGMGAVHERQSGERRNREVGEEQEASIRGAQCPWDIRTCACCASLKKRALSEAGSLT